MRSIRTPQEVAKKRAHFKRKFTEENIIEEITIEGINKKQQFYVKHVLQSNRKKQYTLEGIKKAYFQLAEDSKIQSIFPTLIFNPQTGKYKLNLKIKRQKRFVFYNLVAIFLRGPLAPVLYRHNIIIYQK